MHFLPFTFSLITLLPRGSLPTSDYQSLSQLSSLGTQFQPVHPIEYLASYSNVESLITCLQYCNENVQCRTFVYDSATDLCQIFEGLVKTGAIVTSTSATSRVVSLVYSASLFSAHGQTCNQCTQDRYLQCSNASVCDCPVHTFWNGSFCQNQLYHSQSCSANNWCRADLSLECAYGTCECNLGSSWNGSYCSGLKAITSINDTIVGIWNTTTGGDSQNSSVGYSSGQYPSDQGPSMCIDFNSTTKYLSFGNGGYSNPYTSTAGVGSGFYTIPIVGATLANFFQMQTGDDSPSRDPLTCTLEGSNATGAALSLGSSWTLLYNGSTGISGTADPGRLTWTPIQRLTNLQTVTAYRFLVTSQRNVDDCVQYTEYRLFY